MTQEPPPTGRDASPHPGLERLAELEEGLLDSAAAARVTEHVTSCAHCREEQVHLERAHALLRSLPAEQMPADVAARLDAALAGADEAARTPQPSTVVPLGGSRRRWRIHPAAAGLGAAAAVAALVVALVVGQGGSGGGGSTPEQSASLAQSRANSVLGDLNSTATGTNYTSNNLASTVPPLVAGPAAAMATKQAPVRPNTSAAAGGVAAGTSSGAIPAALARLHDPAALRSCVLGVEAGGQIQRPLAIDFARYLGKPAVLVVLPGLNKGFLDAWFVGPDCSAADAHLLGYKAVPESGSASPGR